MGRLTLDLSFTCKRKHYQHADLISFFNIYSHIGTVTSKLVIFLQCSCSSSVIFLPSDSVKGGIFPQFPFTNCVPVKSILVDLDKKEYIYRYLKLGKPNEACTLNHVSSGAFWKCEKNSACMQRFFRILS